MRRSQRWRHRWHAAGKPCNCRRGDCLPAYPAGGHAGGVRQLGHPTGGGSEVLNSGWRHQARRTCLLLASLPSLSRPQALHQARLRLVSGDPGQHPAQVLQELAAELAAREPAAGMAAATKELHGAVSKLGKVGAGRRALCVLGANRRDAAAAGEQLGGVRSGRARCCHEVQPSPLRGSLARSLFVDASQHASTPARPPKSY